MRSPPDKVEVTGPLEEPALLAWPLDIAPESVRLRTVRPGEGYAGTVAVLSGGRPVTVTETRTVARHRGLPSLAAPAAA